MEQDNCWECLECGREPGGSRVDLLGVCPSTVDVKSEGINHGKTAGRFCWTIEGTLCPGTEEERIEKCSLCPFYLKVQQEEGVAFVQELGMLNI